MLSPYYPLLGPAWFRRFLATLVPDPNFQRLKSLGEIMDYNSRMIYTSRKKALLRGGEAVQQQLGHGKDIMSVLCMFPRLSRSLCFLTALFWVSESEYGSFRDGEAWR